MSRISMPALMLAMGILATIYFLVTSMPSDDGRHAKTSAQSEQELAVPADCEKNMCVEVRRDIPRVVTRGDITLHIPIAADTWTATPPKETNLTRVAVCFPGPRQSAALCGWRSSLRVLAARRVTGAV